MLKRTMALVLWALLASAILATVAFIFAGRQVNIETQTEAALDQDSVYTNLLKVFPEFFDSKEYSHVFFETTHSSGHDYYLVTEDMQRIINCTPSEYLNLTPESYDIVMEKIRQNDFKSSNDDFDFLSVKSEMYDSSILALRYPVNYQGNKCYLISLSYIEIYNDLIVRYLNILILSTLMAAMAMLVPAYMLVRHMVLPIQKINEIAMQYGRGNFKLRADESHKGEVGELGASFNFLADQLSKSIGNLTAEKNQLQEVFNTISDGIVVVDENCKPVTTNEVIKNLFNRADRSNLFTERLQLIPFDEIWEDFEEAIKTGIVKKRTIEHREYAYQSTIIPKFDANDQNRVIGATGFFRDIYEQQKNEQFRQDYVANISHELRTPLQTLRGLIEPLQDGMVKKEEDRQRYYDIIHSETMRLSRLIDDMLELSKLQSRTLAFRTFPFDVNKLISNVEIRFKNVMKEAGIAFKVQNNYGKLPTVMGNPDRVEQILVILLDNAKKYTPKGKSITISTDYIESEKKVFISVADTGQGIHEYDIDHIFDRFFKADRARGKKGSGLGLAIARELLTYMGESITVKSEYGEGATFTFTLTKAEAVDVWE